MGHVLQYFLMRLPPVLGMLQSLQKREYFSTLMPPGLKRRLNRHSHLRTTRFKFGSAFKCMAFGYHRGQSYGKKHEITY